MSTKAAMGVLALTPLFVLLSGCLLDRALGPIDPKVSRAIDVRVGNDGVSNVDVLFVIDDSGSMREEQESLAREIPRLVRGLTSPPDEDGDGEPDWSAVESLHVGIVTTDLGTSGVMTSVGTCGTRGLAGDPWGRDGALRQDASCGDPGAVQRWQQGDDPDAFASRVGCLAEAGIQGCGIEQPLGAALRALDRSSVEGFPRPDALLAVLVLTDEEDCSLADPETFFATIPSTAEVNLHCTRNPDLLAPVEQIVTDLRATHDEDRLLFAAIAGVPLGTSGNDFGAILGRPDMEYVEDPTSSTGLRPVCEAFNPDGTSRGEAAPSRRLVEVASRIPGSLVRSICEESFQPAIAELTHRIGERLRGACLGRELTPDADGSVDCVVRETLPAGMTCDGLPARSHFGWDEEGNREVCEVTQAPGGAGSGWYYDVADPMCDKVAFTDDALPAFGSTVRFVCLVEVESEVPGDVGI